jgi:hypothetical protein
VLVKGRWLLGFWDGSTPAMRVGFYGLCGVFAAVLIQLVASYFNSTWVGYVSIVVMIAGLAVGFWGVTFHKHG